MHTEYTYTINKNRINNFILWCKGWYKPTNPNENIFTQAIKALKLDDYEFVDKGSVIPIILNYIDEMIECGHFSHKMNSLKMRVWTGNVLRYMDLLQLNYEEALLCTIKNFFAYDVDKNIIQLNPPIYTRKLFKLGFVAPKHFGNSYKLQNYKVKKHFGNCEIN